MSPATITASIPNPVLRGYHADPSVCRVGDDYYLVTSSSEFAPGIPVYHSRDLVSWNHVGYALESPAHLGFERARTSLGVWAPTIRHIRGRFYVAFTLATTREWPGMFENYMLSAESAAGPWSKPVFVADGGIDPDLFEDVDGKTYYAHSGGYRIAPIDLATGKLGGQVETLFGGCGGAFPEAGHLFRVDGWYYITLAEGGTGMGHCVTLARSRQLKGPYEPCPSNPVLTNRDSGLPVQSIGHADLVQTPAGEWFAVCLGVRDSDGVSHIGRETFVVPVSWRDGWPCFGENRRVTQIKKMADVVRQPRVLADDFQGATRPFFWNTRMGWGEGLVARGGGRLLLTPNQNVLTQDAPMAWLGVRQPDLACRLRVTLDLGSVAVGQRAGVSAFLSPDFHYAFNAVRSASGFGLRVTAKLGRTAAVLAEVALPANAGEVVLHVEAKPDIAVKPAHNMGAYHFSYSTGAAPEPVEVAQADTRLLGATVAVVYTGVFFALYAEGPATPVVFRDFRCET